MMSVDDSTSAGSVMDLRLIDRPAVLTISLPVVLLFVILIN